MAKPAARPKPADPASPEADLRIRAFSRSLPMALLAAREAVMSRFRGLLKRNGVTEQQWRVLRALAEAEELNASQLAEATKLLMPSLSRILKDLERRGLIRRRVAEADQRYALAAITDQGLALIRRVGPHSEARYAEITRLYGADRLEALFALLDALTHALEGDAAGRAARVDTPTRW